ncbi:hypothetical protein E4L95_18730 [Paracoccus liaowanqingii]|uniref:Chain-length determining protein n=1 Tax=Paracoccus liaowanqingii TaxID=2560053 RepID=A0A4Z1C7T0_9RHOB|nr:hypothetical protein [Paracoccus liaowanqingii]TGN48875.1 hypothetical protein E4L95_18730 [Paracoccus liaowanqingii]
MGPIVGVKEFVAMLRRRGPLMAFVAAVGIYLAMAYAMSLPRAYEAITVIQIQPTLLSGGATAAAQGEPDTANRLRLIEQRLMARDNITDMIERFNLFEDAPELTDDERIAQFRQDVRIDFVPAVGGVPGAEREISAMMITVRTGRAADAANLANDMADQIMTGNQAGQARRLVELIETLEAENMRATAAVTEVESQLSTFRSLNPDRMPENLDNLTAEQTRLESQRSALLLTLQSLERERLALEVGTSADGPPASLSQQLRILEVELAQARRTLPAEHPEVMRLMREIEMLRDGTEQQLPQRLSRQIELIRDQEAALSAERAEIDRRLPQIEAAIEGMPDVASELADYQRRITALELPRAAIAERLAAAQLEQRLASGNYGERMVVLERATVPEHPLSSGRRRVAVLGAAMAVAMALAAGFVMELARPVLRTPAQVRKALGVEPIAFAPYRPTPKAQVMARVQDVVALGILAFGALAVVILILQGAG